jgi:putative membrane protein
VPLGDRGLLGTLLRAPDLEQSGQPPDPRFTFANERTCLAWNRTALALIAAGLGAAQFLHFNVPDLRLLIALPLIALGAVLSMASYRQWVRAERAMRHGEPPPYTQMPRVLALGIVIVAVSGVVVAIIDRIIS